MPESHDLMPDHLPVWNLDDLSPPMSDAARLDRLAEIQDRATALADRWKTRIASADAASLDQLIAEYEAIEEAMARLACRAELAFAADSTDAGLARNAQQMREAESSLGSQLVFIELELAALEDDRLEQLLASTPSSLQHSSAEASGSAPLVRWLPWLRRVRAFRQHQLPEEMEQLLLDRLPAGRSAWVRLFDETAAALRFPLADGVVSEAEILNRMTDPDPAVRREAGEVRSKVLDENSRLMTLVLNTIAKDKSVDDRWRGFPRPVSSRNLANDVEDAVVDALASTVTARMPQLSHRYYRLKASWMDKQNLTDGKLNWWDRNAPLAGADDRHIPWPEARSMIIEAFAGFDPMMARIADGFFEKGWIDAPQRPGKASGAFSHPAVPSVHPYILVNYAGKLRDVMTLAHELGHGVHQVLAGPRGHLTCQTPLTLAETASVFGEMLVFRQLLANTKNPTHRRHLLAGKIEDMLNTVVRQIGFHNFETRFHEARLKGELTAEEIGDIWMETQAEALGPAIQIGADYRPLWGFIPHFIHAPFYVYAYAFGDCLVNALWQVYTTADDAAKRADFISSYMALLRAGGSLHHRQALAPFGLDAADPGFWGLGLDMLAEMIDELEALSADSSGPAEQMNDHG